MNSLTCVCGGTHWSRASRYESKWGPVQLLKCGACGMHRDERVAEDTSLKEMYSGSSIYRAPTAEEFDAQVLAFGHVVADVSRLGHEAGDILDVGCSAGYGLRAFQERGWTVWGVEQNEETREYARSRLTTTIFTDAGSIPDSAKFDAILFSHIIEHIPDPVRFLEPFLAHLRVGGIVYVKVPNYGSRTVRYVMRGAWHSFLPNQHVWYFHTAGLVLLMSRLGFQPVRLYTRERLSARSVNVLKAALKLPVVLWQHLARNDGFELVGIFRRA